MKYAIVARRTRASAQKKTLQKAQPVAAVRVDPEVMEKARELAGGDVRRLRVEPSGSVLVLN